MSENEMKQVRGGAGPCGCSCQYANSGGSSTSSNKSANSAKGTWSTDQFPARVYNEKTNTWDLVFMRIVPYVAHPEFDFGVLPDIDLGGDTYYYGN
jgi:hypothetical protein